MTCAKFPCDIRTSHPHGTHMPCNLYCAGVSHAVVCLGERTASDGSLTDAAALIAGQAPYYAAMGWRVTAAKRIESDRETILRQIWAANPDVGPVTIEAGSTDESPLVENLEDYDPWMFTVVPFDEDIVAWLRG